MDLFEVGEIVKTRGLRGCLKVSSYLEQKDVFARLKFVYIEQASGVKKRFRLTKVDISDKFLFIELEGVSDPETARALVGCQVFLPADILGKLPEGEYYWRDIIGLDVFNEENKYIGKIAAVFPTGSNDVYVCKGEGKEILLPAIADVIRKIDVNQGIMIVKLMEGL